MKVLFLGDFLYDYDKINDDILEISKYIKENDLVTVLNFEGAFKSEKPYKKPINLHCTKEAIEVLKLLNVKAVNLANNHVMDYSEEGLSSLIEALDEAGIGHFGAGMNKEESFKPYILKYGIRKIYLYGFGWKMEECVNATDKKAGTAPIDYNFIQKVMDDRKKKFVIFSFHFGYEYECLPQPYHFKKCREIVRCKRVKAVFGHHPHVVQGYDKHNNIFYSLGNFYFGSMRKRYTKDFKHYPDVNQGIGVILNMQDWKTEIVKFVTEGEVTRIDRDVEIKNFVDTCRIPVHLYPKYFKKNNNHLNKRYIYGISDFHTGFWNKTHYIRRSLYKFYLRKIKWPLGKKIKKILSFVKGKCNEK